MHRYHFLPLPGLLLLAGPSLAQTCVPAVVTAFPYVENFDGATVPNAPCGITVLDVNNDGVSWGTQNNLANSVPNVMRYNFNSRNSVAAEDWFFTPALHLKAGSTYQLQFVYRAASASFREALEVKVGAYTSPASQTTLLFSNPAIGNVAYTATTAGLGAGQVASFKPTTTDTYYVGFHAFSPANAFTLFVDDISITESTPLPVQLVGFEAAPAGPSAVHLTWATASEVNSAYFAVERSLDGSTFGPVGRVAAAGSSPTTRTYAFTDAALPAVGGLLYYRLRQVDLDGTTTYSPVRSVAEPAMGLSFFPSPATGLTTFTCLRATTLVVRDALGRTCRVLSLPAGGQAVDLTALPLGVYTLTDEATSQTLRLLKQQP